LDEVFVRINCKIHYLWRAVDHEGEVRDASFNADLRRYSDNALSPVLRKSAFRASLIA
jgi:transposase-like protein